MRQKRVLPDVLKPGLKVVFCGTRPGNASAARGAYYAHPGNRFWRTLHEVGLTPRRLDPAEFRSVTEYGIGLTDLAKHSSGQDDDILDTELDRVGLGRKLRRYQPDILAFTGKRAASAVLGTKTGRLKYGLQDYIITLDTKAVYVLPSPSGLAASFWDIRHWQELAREVKRLTR